MLYPQRCAYCGEVVEYDDMWCGKCEPPAGDRDSLKIPHGIEDVAAPFAYEDKGRIRRIILHLKEHENKRYLQFLAEGIASEITTLWPDVSFDLIVPIPASETNLLERGFHQAERRASHLATIIEVPVEPRALSRRDDSKKQRLLSAEQRRINAANSYDLEDATVLPVKTILLVDDVVTTGATLTACAALLREAGAADVYAIAAAQTPWKLHGEEQTDCEG
jgi:ComF family protein